MTKREIAIDSYNSILHRLSLGHMSVMIGAGFSMNAVRRDESRPMPPDWKGLAQALAARLYPNGDAAHIAETKTALELGSEYAAKEGRSALEEFLREQINDENLLPGKLHAAFFKLPWSEVFTTNYDTLLEKATEDVLVRRFQVIKAKDELIESESPRIVKLHGSVDCTERPLIFTEEDYRTYETANEPLVNLVRQTLIEDRLCLIGFSGKDPNFKKWDGWFRDEYCADADDPRIFLVGAEDIPEPEIAALAKRGIRVLDLRECFSDCDGDVAQLLGKFFEGLLQNPTNLEWKASYFNNWDCQTPEQEVISKIETLGRERVTQPNQLVLPHEKLRQCVEASNMINEDAFTRLLTMPSPWDLRGLYELCERFDMCLSPLFYGHRMKETFETIMKRYADLFRKNQLESAEQIDQRRWFVSLVMAHLRWNRVYCDVDRWNYDLRVLREIINRQDPWLANEFIYERALQALALPDVRMLDSVMDEWKGMFRTEKANVRYASLLLELGRVDEAVPLLKKTLADIRRAIPRGRFKGNVEPLSIEGVAIVALNMAQSTGESKSENFERLRQLANYGCNPWQELINFESLLSAPERKREDITQEQDLDQDNKSIHSEYTWPEEGLHAFQLIRYFEKMGLPVFTPTSTLVAKAWAGAVARASSYAPGLGFGMYVRTGKGKDVSLKNFFGFEGLRKMSRQAADGLTRNYVGQVNYLLDKHIDALSSRRTNYYRKLAANLVEVISRLSFRNGPEALAEALALGIRIYSTRMPFRGILFSDLGRYFKRVLSAMSPEDVFKHLDELLAIEVPVDRQKDFDWQIPVRIDWRGFESNPESISTSLERRLDELINRADTDDWVVRSDVLVYWRACLDVGIVSEDRKRRMAEVLLRHVEKDGFVPDRHLYKIAFKELFRPTLGEGEINERLISYYKGFKFPLFCNEDGEHPWLGWHGDPTSAFTSSILLSSSVFAENKQYRVELSEDVCVTLVRSFIERLRVDGERVRKIIVAEDPFGNCEHMLSRVHNYDMVMSDVVLPRVTNVSLLVELERCLIGSGMQFAFPSSAIVIDRAEKRDMQSRWSSIRVQLAQARGMRAKQLSDAVFLAYRHGLKFGYEVPPDEMLWTLVEIISTGGDKELQSACRALVGISREYRLPVDVCEFLDSVLWRMAESTASGDNDRLEDGERLFAYGKIVKVAVALYAIKVKETGSCDLSGVKAWRDYCNGEEAFSEHRNTWNECLKIYLKN